MMWHWRYKSKSGRVVVGARARCEPLCDTVRSGALLSSRTKGVSAEAHPLRACDLTSAPLLVDPIVLEPLTIAPGSARWRRRRRASTVDLLWSIRVPSRRSQPPCCASPCAAYAAGCTTRARRAADGGADAPRAAAVRAVGCMPLSRAAARVPRRVCSPPPAERRAEQSGPVRPMRVGARIGPQRLGGAALAEPSLVEPRAPY
jgi:hypothetical protein